MAPDRRSVDSYAWDTICERCGVNLGGHIGWTCPNGRGGYDGPLVRHGVAPEPDLRAVNAALVKALQLLLRPDGHTLPCAYDEYFGNLHCTDWACQQARTALELATGGPQ